MGLILRLVKGAPLLYAELDANFLYLSSSFLGLDQTGSITAATASYVTASSVYGPFGSNSILTASYALSGSTPSLATTASYVSSSNVFGPLGFDSVATASYFTNAVIAVSGSTLYTVNPSTNNFNTTRSIFLGNQAGEDTVQTYESIFLGYTAGYQATNAIQSNYVGIGAGYQATNSSGSAYFGWRAGYKASDADRSVFIGKEAGSLAYKASGSVMIGELAGISSSLAHRSVLIGNLAGANAYSAKESIMIGHTAGQSATSASQAIFIGTLTGYEASGAFQSTFIGYQAGYSAHSAFGSTFIGNGSGINATNATNAVMIGGAGESALQAASAVFIGPNAGFEARNAANSIFLGTESGYSAAEADSAVFIGNLAGNFAVSASNSNFVGANAGYTAYSASLSNFIGSNAGYGAENASGSSFIGYEAGKDAVDAFNSIFIGYGAGKYSYSASYSTVLGYKAGARNPTTLITGISRNNIIIGTNITLPQGAINAINIGGVLFGTGSYSDTNSPTFSGSADGKIGINTPAPLYTLDIAGTQRIDYTNVDYTNTNGDNSHILLTNGSPTGQTVLTSIIHGQVTGKLRNDFAGNMQYITNGTGTGGNHYFFTEGDYPTGTVKLTISSSGQVGIGTTTPTAKLEVAGNVLATSFTGSLQGTSSWAISASWAPGGTSTPATPGGSDTFIQFNSGSTFTGTGSFVYNYVSQSLQQGLNVTASGIHSHAQGQFTTASGNYSHTEGNYTKATGDSSHAEGWITAANGNYSHAEGYGATASGNYSHAEGRFTKAIGVGSHAEGEQSSAYGLYSNAKGLNTVASGSHALSVGSTTVALGAASFAAGYNTIASGSYQTVVGQFNMQNDNTSLFIVGNGASTVARKDVLKATTSGIQITGSLIVSSSGNLIATVMGSGSSDPIFRVLGSTGELFKVYDSLSGSLFAVNDISGLPVLTVNSDQTVLMGSTGAPLLNTTVKQTITGTTGDIVYQLPTSSYDAFFWEMVIMSASARGTCYGSTLWSGSQATTDISNQSEYGSALSLFSWGASIVGSDFALAVTASTSGWTVKTIIRGI